MDDNTQTQSQTDQTQNDTTTPVEAPFDIETYKATLETVRRRLTLIESMKTELKQAKDMYDDMFVNDELYNKANDLVKEASKKRKEIQVKLVQQPGTMELQEKLKRLKGDLKENEETLTQELMDYYKTAGVTEIEDADGNVQEFKILVRLKPKRKTQ